MEPHLLLTVKELLGDIKFIEKRIYEQHDYISILMTKYRNVTISAGKYVTLRESAEERLTYFMKLKFNLIYGNNTTN